MMDEFDTRSIRPDECNACALRRPDEIPNVATYVYIIYFNHQKEDEEGYQGACCDACMASLKAQVSHDIVTQGDDIKLFTKALEIPDEVKEY